MVMEVMVQEELAREVLVKEELVAKEELVVLEARVVWEQGSYAHLLQAASPDNQTMRQLLDTWVRHS